MDLILSSTTSTTTRYAEVFSEATFTVTSALPPARTDETATPQCGVNSSKEAIRLGWKSEIPSEVKIPDTLRSVVNEGYARSSKRLKTSWVSGMARSSSPSRSEWNAHMWMFSLYFAMDGLDRTPIILSYPSGQLMHQAPVNSITDTCLSYFDSTCTAVFMVLTVTRLDSSSLYTA